MKHLILVPALAAIAFSAACSKAATPDTTATAPAEAAAPPEAAAPAGPKVGDKIGQSEDDTYTVPDPSIAAAAAEALRKEEEIKARGVTPIGWEDLMPEGEAERLEEMYAAQIASMYAIAEGSVGDAPVQFGSFSTVDTYNGQKIRIPGYTVPFSYDAKAEIREFLLVPYYGACIHAPPPPPNQTIFVRTETPVLLKDLPQAAWVEGTLHAQRQNSDLADSAYVIDMSYLEKYKY